MKLSSVKSKPKIGLFYPDIDKGGGYPTDVLRLFNELMQNERISVIKIKNLAQLSSEIQKIDCLHVFGFFSNHKAIACLLCILLGKKYVISTFGQLLPATMAIKSWKKNVFISCYGRFILNSATKIHVFTDYEVQELLKLKITTATFKCFFGIYPENVQPTNEEKLIKGIEKPFLLFFGRLDIFQKGLDILLEGFVKYAKSSANIDLVIAGRDYKGGSDFIKNFSKKNPFSDRIHFLGEITSAQKEELYQSAQAIIYPCHFDGNPRPLRHALCRKKRILTTYQSNFADCLESKNWGFLFEDTSEALAKAIVQFKAIKNILSYENPNDTRSWQHCTNQFENAYLRITNI